MPAYESSERFSTDRKLVNSWLSRALRFGKGIPKRLAEAMRYAVLGPGKRIRAVLALEAFRAARGEKEQWVVPFCCGIEMIHAFSLVHDDLPSMDDDDFRRGRPSLHRRFDVATAILGADALFAYAFQLFAKSSAPCGRRIAAIELISRTVGPGGMAGGQMLDITANMHLSKPGLERLNRKKTADFLAAALVTGAIIAGARGETRDRLWRAGRILGSLFQTTDDLLDRDEESDRNRMTTINLYGPEGTRRRAVREARQAERLFHSFGPRYEILAGFPQIVLERTF
ncbi:hypothetical protein CH330_07445 [candidate division WOR-3 bacterium JGI_Cruoil_03_51_56]|uniref:Polyprenyl synthetase n=1 Tax=candidate division WOR-3 bacterium JGI_Cruoil_03_51_56 TaxID=1973747 RepID=A0A235BS78_UNCW3|nr:MAG: hypothetical protein CH330_07445 [candidate division WOR-3 bacterium JGI_Cruoil_03_51_56]